METTKKYELTDEVIEEDGVELRRIRAVRDFGNVKVGDLGGFVQSEMNLSHEGLAWISGDARVFGNAEVFGDARVFGNAEVFGNAWVFGDARVFDNAEVCGNAEVFGIAWVYGNAWVYGDARVFDNAEVCGNAEIQSCDDLCGFGYFGSENRYTTAYRTKDGGISVCCGCFWGRLEQFRERVKKTHGTGDYAIEYLMIADLIEHKLSKRGKV